MEAKRFMPCILKSGLVRIFLIIIFLSANFSSQAEEKTIYPYKKFEPFKMVFLPDINLSFNESGEKILLKESMVIFQDVIKNLNTEEFSPDFVVFGGDLTHNSDGKYKDMQIFLDIASELNSKYYAVLGDREANIEEKITKAEFAKEFDEFNYETTQQTYWAAEPVEDVLLVGLDSSVRNKKSGYINLHQLFWLDEVLKNNRDKFTIIVMHHPPVISTPIDRTVWKKYTLEKPELFIELINLYPQVKLILSGHHFNNYVFKENEKLFLSIPSIVVYPNIYKNLTVYPDRIEIDKEKISFKQIIDKAKEKIVKSYFAKEYSMEKPKEALDFLKGNRQSRKKEYYFGEKKSNFFFWF